MTRRPSHRRHNRDWPRRRHCPRAVSVISLTMIIKETWPRPGSPERERPWPYRLAYARKWITADAFYDVEPVPTGRTNPGIGALVYQSSPFFSMLKRDTAFTSQETA